jgi:hypothetical protein
MFLDEAHRATRLSEILSSRGDEIFRSKDTPLTYYACASIYYRVDWLLRNGYIPKTYGPARFHFVAGFRSLLLGPDRLPDAPRALKAACDQLVECAWNPQQSQDVAKVLRQALLEALNPEGGSQRMGDAVRTSRFRRSMADAVIALRNQPELFPAPWAAAS